jgi:ABC-type phosphate transport system substrate-binding protein
MRDKLGFRGPLSFVVVALSVVLLVACGGDDDASNGSTPEARTTAGATLSAAISGTSTPSPLVTQAKQQYCEARDGFKASVQQLTTLSTSSSLDDVKRINANIKAKWGDLKASARNVGQVQLEELDKSVTKLQTAVDNLGQNTGIVAALTSVALPAAEVVQEMRKVDLDKPCTT